MGFIQAGLRRAQLRRAGLVSSGGGGGGSITNLTSANGSITIVNPAGPVADLSTSFGGAPPAVASSSATGVALTSSHSDHTHALDVVAYSPSLGTMQNNGVIQQTWVGPAPGTATPTVTTIAATLVPFGNAGGSGILATNVRLAWIAGSGGLGTGLFASDTNAAQVWPFPGNNTQLFTAQIETGSAAFGAVSARNSAGAIGWTNTRMRGTLAAALAVLPGDSMVNFFSTGWSGTNKVTSASLSFTIPSDAVIGATTLPQYFGFVSNADANGNPNNLSNYSLAVDTRGNNYTGIYTLLVGSTDGFHYLPSFAGVVTGVPAQTFGSIRAGNRTPTYIDTTDLRNYAYIGGAWHFSQMMDYDPTTARIPFGGATAHTLVDSANLFYLSAGSNLAIQSPGSSATPASVLGVQLSLINDSGTSTARIYGFNSSVSAGTLALRHANGTFAAPTVSVVSDHVGQVLFAARDTANYTASLILASVVPADAAIGANNISQFGGICSNTGAPGNAVAGNALDIIVGADSDGNAYAGSPIMTTTSSHGFFYVVATAGPPTVAPTRVFNDANRAFTRSPVQIDDTDRRWYLYTAGAWHFAQFTDYSPTATRVPFGGATAGTFTDATSIVYDSTNQTLTLAGTGGLTTAPLVVNNGSAGGTAINFTGGATTILENAGNGIALRTTGVGAVSLTSAAGTCVQVNQAGDVSLGFQNSLAVNATAGFSYMRNNGASGVGGTPTGVPTLPYNGQNPFLYDETNHKFWVYDRGTAAWRGVVLI